jgi:hypothetical protein
VRQSPGFVAGYFTRPAEDRGVGLVVYESEDAAKAAQQEVRSAPNVGTTLIDVQVAEVVAHI